MKKSIIYILAAVSTLLIGCNAGEISSVTNDKKYQAVHEAPSARIHRDIMERTNQSSNTTQP